MEEVMKSKLSHIYEGEVIGNLLTVKNTTELRGLENDACNTKRKMRKNLVKGAERWVRGGLE